MLLIDTVPGKYDTLSSNGYFYWKNALGSKFDLSTGRPKVNTGSYAKQIWRPWLHNAICYSYLVSLKMILNVFLPYVRINMGMNIIPVNGQKWFEQILIFSTYTFNYASN